MTNARFHDALAPLRQQAGWQLDAARSTLADRARALQDARDMLRRHEALVAEQLAHMAPAATPFALDPAVARNRVAYLSRAADRARLLVDDVATAEDAHAQQQVHCQALQLKLEALEKHRAEQVALHRAEQARRAGVLADDDWLVRTRFTMSTPQRQGGEETSP